MWVRPPLVPLHPTDTAQTSVMRTTSQDAYIYRNGELVEPYSGDREFLEYLNMHAEPTATSHDEAEITTPTTSTEQEPTPTPALTPPEHLVVQTPRSNANPSGIIVALFQEHAGDRRVRPAHYGQFPLWAY